MTNNATYTLSGLVDSAAKDGTENLLQKMELFLTPRWKAIRLFLLTNINLCQLQSEYFADVSTFFKLISQNFSNRISLKILFYHTKFFRKAGGSGGFRKISHVTGSRYQQSAILQREPLKDYFVEGRVDWQIEHMNRCGLIFSLEYNYNNNNIT